MGNLKHTTQIFCEHLPIIINSVTIILISIVIFRNWIFTSEWPAGGDVLGWISRAYIFGNDFRWLYTWRPYSFGFSQGIDSMDFFLALIHLVSRDAATTVKILTFSSFLTAGFTMYAFAYHYTSRHLAALSASLVYCLNQWFFSQLTEMHLHIIFSYALAPLVFLSLDRALQKRNLKNMLAFALVLSISFTGFHPQFILIYGFFLSIFFIFYILASIKSHNFKINVTNVLKIFLITGVLCFLLSAFSFLPFVFNVRAPYYSQTYGYPIEDAIRASYRNIVDTITLRALESWGYKSLINIYTDLSLPGCPVYTILLLIFSLAFCTVFFRRDRYTAFFAFSTIISIFIANGPNSPFGYVFTWAWNNIPHFSVLRAASRLAAITAFSSAFFVANLTDLLVTYIKKRGCVKIEKIFLKAKVVTTQENEGREVCISLGILNKAIKHKFFYYLSLIILISILLIGFLTCFYFLGHGLQTYTPPQSYIKPYHWFANQTGDYKVVTTTNSPSQWEHRSKQESDFAFSGMKTSLGWGHDIGYDSSFIHDKPVLQDGGWNPPARHFIDYLRFHLVRKSLTKNFCKMIGAFNYKYIVLPEYLVNDTRNFFLQQEGYHLAYDNQGSIILQNKYYTSRFFAVNDYAYVVGGLETFQSLCNINTFNLNQTALIFINRMDNVSFSDPLFNRSRVIIFVNSDMVDATMLSLRDQAVFITASDYGMLSLNYSRYWARASSWRTVGAFVWGGETLTTSGKNNVTMPFKVESNGVYDVWLRVGFAPNRGKLTILIDEKPINEIQPSSKSWSRMKWINVGSLNLTKGVHKIILKNDGKGYNDIDVVAIVKPDKFQSKMNNLLNTLQDFPGRIIHLLEAENTFTLNLPANWQKTLLPYEGYVLHTECPSANISPQGNASASSLWVWSDGVNYEACKAVDGDPNTRWASKHGMPQWLQVEWSTPQQLIGVRILFERAYAEDYLIQTWNGTGWVNQVNVTGNNQLKPLHYFEQPVQTTKLRIYVTKAPAFNMVSIWELEALTPSPISPISTEVFIPREGYYMFALRLAQSQDQGTPYLKVDNMTVPLQQAYPTMEAQWYEGGPIHLNRSNHTIEVSALGKIDFDQMFIYSLNGEGDFGFLDGLFEAKPGPHVSYEKINPCKYEAHIENSDEPFLLIFSESYHPMWKAYVEGEEISPIPVYSIVNGFYINKTGNFNVTIYFTGQTYADIGLKISTLTFIVVIAYLIIPPKTFKRIKGWILMRFKNFKRKIFTN